MLSIKISRADLDYLIGSHIDQTIRGNMENNYVKEFDTIYLNVEKPVAEIILDFLGNELMRVGIAENDEPNEQGIMLESIIDKFSREIYG